MYRKNPAHAASKYTIKKIRQTSELKKILARNISLLSPPRIFNSPPLILKTNQIRIRSKITNQNTKQNNKPLVNPCELVTCLLQFPVYQILEKLPGELHLNVNIKNPAVSNQTQNTN